jgi:hypothetical protein
MSSLQRVFGSQKVQTSSYTNWPTAQARKLSGQAFSMAVNFKGDLGYLRISKVATDSYIEMKAYATKTTLKQSPCETVLSVNATVDEFLGGNFDPEKVKVETSVQGEKYNMLVHGLRLMTSYIGDPNGYRNARRSILL